jgi:hypothetical protein
VIYDHNDAQAWEAIEAWAQRQAAKAGVAVMLLLMLVWLILAVEAARRVHVYSFSY